VSDGCKCGSVLLNDVSKLKLCLFVNVGYYMLSCISKFYVSIFYVLFFVVF